MVMIYIRITGGLGNQLFQYAAARYLQLRKNDGELVLDISGYNCDRWRMFALGRFETAKYIRQNRDRASKYNQDWHVIVLDKVLDLINKQNDVHKKMLLEKLLKYPLQSVGIIRNSFSNDLYSKFLLRNRNIYMSGYFQSEEFFPGIRGNLLDELQIKGTLGPEKKIVLNEIKRVNSVCIHVRLGDYKKNKLHMVCTKRYYRNAVNLIKRKYPNAKFFVFSDEIETVKTEYGLFGDEFEYEPSGCRDYEVLELMKNCNHFIMSNSSLSWWAQYLCTFAHKTVIAPDIWFNDTSYSAMMYQKEWIILHARG